MANVADGAVTSASITITTKQKTLFNDWPGADIFSSTQFALETTAPPYAADQPSDQGGFQAPPFTDQLRLPPPAPGPLIEIR
jgi:hypothetical protein